MSFCNFMIFIFWKYLLFISLLGFFRMNMEFCKFCMTKKFFFFCNSFINNFLFIFLCTSIFKYNKNRYFKTSSTANFWTNKIIMKIFNLRIKIFCLIMEIFNFTNYTFNKYFHKISSKTLSCNLLKFIFHNFNSYNSWWINVNLMNLCLNLTNCFLIYLICFI